MRTVGDMISFYLRRLLERTALAVGGPQDNLAHLSWEPLSALFDLRRRQYAEACREHLWFRKYAIGGAIGKIARHMDELRDRERQTEGDQAPAGGNA
jgi:hypothetical protein